MSSWRIHKSMLFESALTFSDAKDLLDLRDQLFCLFLLFLMDLALSRGCPWLCEITSWYVLDYIYTYMYIYVYIYIYVFYP